MKRAPFKRGRAAARPYIIACCTLLCALCLFAFAVTYRVDPANGPETLATEVKEAFDAWIALSDKVEASETQENPEAVFQYGATERFGEDTLSLTVQRQTDTRSIIYLISPNAENRQRILLHETGIAIGLTPQIPGTPLPNAPTPPTPPVDGTEQPSEGQETFETTPLPETTPTDESGTTSETTDSSTTEPSGEGTSENPSDTSSESTESGSTSEESASSTEQTSEGQDSSTSASSEQPQGPANQDSSTEQSTETQSSEEQSAEGTTPSEETEESTTPETPETPAQALIPNNVMNPSISPDDSLELGEFEKQLLEQLQLFVSEDINRDGAVNFYDLVALAQAFGRSGVNDPADINKDGLINQADVDELKKSYTFSDPSETPPGGSTSTTTDETPPEGTDNPDGTSPPEESLAPEESLPPPDDGTSDSQNE
jgi:hypothetical protein